MVNLLILKIHENLLLLLILTYTTLLIVPFLLYANHTK